MPKVIIILRLMNYFASSNQTANLCGMIWIAPMVLNSVLPAGIEGPHNVSDEEILEFGQSYRKYLEDYKAS